MHAYANFALKHTRLLYMLRVSFVLGVILLITRMFTIPYGYWALITAVTILGAIPFVGGVLSKAKQRVTGTIVGAVLGLLLFLIPPQYHWTHHFAFFGVLIAAMYYTQEKYAYASLMAAITIVIVAGGGPADVAAAGWRIFNVLWAAILTIFASLFIFPAKATERFIYLLEQYLVECSHYYAKHIKHAQQGKFPPSHAERLNTIIETQQSLLPHMLVESGVNKSVLGDVLLIEKRLFAELEALLSTQWESQQGQDEIMSMEGLTTAQSQLADNFQVLAQQVSDKRVTDVDPIDIKLLNLTKEQLCQSTNDISDISYYGYLWLNREMARQFIQLSNVSAALFRAP
ncbi:FUSC family protein [Enterovibrio nigricans]|uniref:Fusaric acid resistance protein family protein n=1 Tax=Enterovibrio nigricans DSM 22720 TaxID=1121868 RepID=A0A1T4UUN7_9GAMM|nr:FUSC family protein [Enterovibrio nigricans]SKA56413.1 Fusaric acid resistance protein family protein [Enterovibrio nigricans DSM 22720]